MALLSPSQIHEVLRPLTQVDEDPKNLPSLLNKAGLSKQEVLDNIATVMRLGDTDNVKLQAAKLGAQLNGLLEENDTGRSMNVTIIIHDSEYTTINPILITR